MYIVGFSNADWCGDKQDSKSTPGYLFKFYYAQISWYSKKQPVVALPTCESEYILGSLVAFQAIWIVSILKELKIEVRKPMTMFLDNKFAIDMA